MSVDWHSFIDKSDAEDEIYISRNLHTFENFNSPQWKFLRDNAEKPTIERIKHLITLKKKKKNPWIPSGVASLSYDVSL